jgi:S-(hydroxymethyl)glutathione dehydrogenase/alcohol dehydrogenase
VWAGVVPYTQTSVNLDAFTLTLFQKSILGTCYGGASPFEMVPKLIKMYRSGILKIDELVTKEYKLEQINDSFADMLAGKNICGLIRL